MKRSVLILVLLCAGTSTFGQSNKAWRDIIEKCNPTDEIGKQTLFFGVSNLIGPGSMWRRATDKSIRLVYELSDGFPNQTDQADIVRGSNIASCSETQSSKWNIKLGLPFSTGATPLTFDIGLTLGKAHDIDVSIAGYAVDALDEGKWKDHLKTLGSSNGYYNEAYQAATTVLLAENVVKVSGFRAVFNYSTDLSADLSAKFKGKSFVLGNSATGAGNMLGNSKGANANKAASPNPGSSPGSATAIGNKAETGTCPGNNNADDDTATAKSKPAAAADKTKNTSTNPAANPTQKDSTSGNSGDSLATLHVDFSGKRQITVCANGPFYVLAAFSKVKLGNPVGLAPGAKPSILLIASPIPENTAALDKDSSKP